MLRLAREHYGRHAIAAAPGTQKAIVDALLRHRDLTARILDLGAYTGALISRIKDEGFVNVSGSDLANHLLDQGVAFVQSDFNTRFSENFPGAQFDCIIACEVIEHLDDPRRFLVECAKMLAKDGIVIVSTPNIAFFEGRIKFLLTGELWGFGAHNYRVQRHISPISIEQFPLLFRECGFQLAEMCTEGSFATPLRKLVTAPIWGPMRLLFGKHVLGESLIAVARRVEDRETRLTSDALWGTGRKLVHAG